MVAGRFDAVNKSFRRKYTMVSKGNTLKIVGVLTILAIVLLSRPSFKYYVSISVNKEHLLPTPKEVYHASATKQFKAKRLPTSPIPPVKKKVKLVPKYSSTIKPKTISKQNQNTTNLKYLVYLCDKNRRCGGWGDRQRGIVTAYVWACILNRTFKVVMTSACDLTQFYQPNKINWILDENEIRNKTSKVLDVVNRVDVLIDKDFKPHQHIDVLYVKTNSPMFTYYLNHNRNAMPDYLKGFGSWRDKVKIFKAVWSRLMIPTDRITNQLLNATKPMFIDGYRANLVTAHVRIGRSKYLPYERVALSLNSTDIVMNFLDKYKYSRIYVATDHADVRKAAIAKLGKRYIGSYAPFLNPDNTARGTKLACWAFQMTIVDQLMMLNADVLVISPSGLSAFAAYLKLNRGELFLFNGTVVSPYKP
ncbi:hypothetical protein LOTGIDRAFT_233308 [Lottia gigantea]|uniref:GT23 domain-containing protein n=1 Tax=Lottia gigantea TaxID=225164 RepID=V4BSP4_LOTGI|nr:hypothetical protein LOTGIDRAFT_233308 [Lottia gigantea]ESO92049.1 hypothetical protein LOTGIDRAFT_233308 [Lottia gigantea]